MNNLEIIKPLSFWKALLYFGIPAGVAILVVYVAMPVLEVRGVPLFINYLLVYATAPMLALMAASLVAYRLEGNAVTWSSFKARFRLNQMKASSFLAHLIRTVAWPAFSVISRRTLRKSTLLCNGWIRCALRNVTRFTSERSRPLKSIEDRSNRIGMEL